ncbi:MAG: protein BatD [Proteobacteria bacterium]|nr:protein BatD [Pseudomonadota bacterium]
MVTTQRNCFRDACLIFCAALLHVSVAVAGVAVSLDRPSVDLNESFLLKIVVDSNIDMEPDFTVLDENFYRGQVSQLSNTSIINGQIRRSRTWSIALMAKSTGTQEIPAISIGNETSEPIPIVVNEPTNAPPGEADVFVTSEIDQTDAYVQAQILYRIKVYRAVATRQPALREPTITGVEALVELAGDERTYETVLKGKAYSVVERVLAIFPQESGEIAISPAKFEARILRNGRITGRKVFESGSHTINVLPIPAPPADFPNAAWLPARDVQLSEEWSREPSELEAGEPITRHVTISVLGQIETQIPAIEPPVIDGMNVYADKPELTRRIEAEGIRGIRKDQYALIGVRGGTVEIPELEVPWWNIEAGEWRVARLPARTLRIDAPAEAAVVPPGVPPAASADEADDPQSLSAADGFWIRVSQLLAAAWLLTVLSWWWSSRDRKRETKEPLPPPIYKQQAKFVKAARKAAAAGDKTGVRDAIIAWGRLQWPGNAPRNIGDFASRVTSPLADELQALSAVSYSNAAGEWNGKALGKALRSISVLVADEKATEQQPLPPLMPPGT